jgi:transcriptional regulator with XRE-family HTH domain
VSQYVSQAQFAERMSVSRSAVAKWESKTVRFGWNTKKTCQQIISSATRPIDDLDNRLTMEGFQAWYEQHKKEII